MGDQDQNQFNQSDQVVNSRAMIMVEESNDTDLSSAGSNPWPSLASTLNFLNAREKPVRNFNVLFASQLLKSSR